MEKAGERKRPIVREAPESSELVSEAVRVEGSPTRCPYCHEDCASEADARVCAGCLARHHGACWDELGRCGSCQSERALSEVAGSPKPRACQACDSDKSATTTCLGCERDICLVCYRQRFRRCGDCCGSLIQTERRLAELREQRFSKRIGLFVLSLLSVFIAAIPIVHFLRRGEGLDTLGSVMFVLIAAILGFGIWAILRSHPHINAEVESLEEQLAHFEQDKVSEALETLRRAFASIKRKLRGQR